MIESLSQPNNNMSALPSVVIPPHSMEILAFFYPSSWLSFGVVPLTHPIKVLEGVATVKKILHLRPTPF